MKDSAGRLLVQVTRSPNRLYKTPIEVEYPRCLLAQDNSVPTATWHARLGHISIGVMNNMVKQEMVVGMPKMVHEKNVKLDKTLREMGFNKCKKEPSVYLKKDKGSVLIIAIYVDDLFVTGTSRKMIDLFKKEMSRKFEMSDLKELCPEIYGTCHLWKLPI